MKVVHLQWAFRAMECLVDGFLQALKFIESKLSSRKSSEFVQNTMASGDYPGFPAIPV